MKIIYTKNKNEILVDDDDFEFLSKRSWCLNEHGYALSQINKKMTRMHRLLMNINDPKIIIDHIDGNRLNNQKSNLRVCTIKENTRNRSADKGGTSKFKGVYRSRSGKWCALINRKHLGTFSTEEQAAHRYNLEAIKIHGEFAKLNQTVGQL